MYAENSQIATYSGEYGDLEVDFLTGQTRDNLNRRLIEVHALGTKSEQETYREIGETLLDDGCDGDALAWGLNYTDDGVIFEDGVNYRLELGDSGVKLFLPHPDMLKARPR